MPIISDDDIDKAQSMTKILLAAAENTGILDFKILGMACAAILKSSIMELPYEEADKMALHVANMMVECMELLKPQEFYQ